MFLGQKTASTARPAVWFYNVRECTDAQVMDAPTHMNMKVVRQHIQQTGLRCWYAPHVHGDVFWDARPLAP
jgi:hypothetical protein